MSLLLTSTYTWSEVRWLMSQENHWYEMKPRWGWNAETKNYGGTVEFQCGLSPKS